MVFVSGMHERYTVLYSILAYMYFIIYDRKKILLAVGIELITCITYFLYLYGLEVLPFYPLLAVINLSILFYLIYDALKVLKENQTFEE